MTVVDERPLDLPELFRALAEHGVEYLVIGGVAATSGGSLAHGAFAAAVLLLLLGAAAAVIGMSGLL